MESYTIKSFDSYPIAVREFIPNEPLEKIVVISPAVGVPQSFYYNFSNHLRSKGYHVFTFDYRGIGLSKYKSIQSHKNFGFISWAKDFESVSNHIADEYPNFKKYIIGHSFGGNSLGLSKAYQNYQGIITVGSQFGYYKNFDIKMRMLILLNFQFLIPVSTKLLDYYPSNWFGLGEALPAQAAKDWATLLLERESLLKFGEILPDLFYDQIVKDMLVISIDDDNFAPKKAVDLLPIKLYKNARVTQKHLIPKDYNLDRIGHFDFFRKKNRDILWPIITDWIEEN